MSVEKTVYMKAISRKQLRAAWVMAGLAVLAIVVLEVIVLLWRPGSIHHRDYTHWLRLAVMVMAAGSIPATIALQRNVRLTIDKNGMTYETNSPPWMRGLTRFSPWSASWSDIAGAKVLKKPAVVRLSIIGRAQPVILDWSGWVPVHQDPDLVPPVSAGPTSLESSPVWKALASQGILKKHFAGTTILDFDLFAHPTSRAALVIAGLLAGIGLLLTFLESETYIADGYSFLYPHVVAGAAGFVLFHRILMRVHAPSRLPTGIAPGLAAFGGLGCALASYGGLLELNRITAPAEHVVYVEATPCTTLEPTDRRFPRIIFTSALTDYWCQYKKGTEFTIDVRTGLFGTYQFDQGLYVKMSQDFHARQHRAVDQRDRR